jgi:diaminopimelate decarboxylase
MNPVQKTLAVVESLRSGCRGLTPLSGRLEPWQVQLCREPDLLAELLELHGSPINILDPRPMVDNVAELQGVAAQLVVDLRIYFARKANKALVFVDEAKRLGLGVDLASERELIQALDRDFPAADMVMTAAVKPTTLLDLCVTSGVTVMIDNEDELKRIDEIAVRDRRRASIALRLAPRLAHPRIQTRFGLGMEAALNAASRHCHPDVEVGAAITGIHFHLDGYDPSERVAAIGEALQLVERLRALGNRPQFIDIGGGIPMSYLDSEGEWTTFWSEHRRALLAERPPLTYEGHGLGQIAHEGQILGKPNVYPYHQALTRGRWLEQVLGASIMTPGGLCQVAQALRGAGLQLRCEPGRSLLDGCGITVGRVEFRKQRLDGTWLIGVAMNRTQCRSTSEDHMVDPLLIRPSGENRKLSSANLGPIEGYLMGAYCIERELLTWRAMRFPGGVEVGDLVVFPNTGGYLMHILESSSHQIPLARNLVLQPDASLSLDAIDGPGA